MFRYICLAFLLCTLFTFSQTNNKRLDSLLHISKQQKDTLLIATLNEVSWEFKNVNTDSALYYAKKALKLSKQYKYEDAVATSYNSLASVFDVLGKLDSAKVYHKKSLAIKLKYNDRVGVANSYNNLGINADQQGDYAKALDYYFKALKIYESENVSFHKVPMVLSNIGIVYKAQKEYKKTINYYKKALKIYKNNNYNFGIVVTTGNIGSVLLNLKAYDSSIVYSEKAKAMYSNLGFTRYIPYTLHNIAIAKDSLKQYSEAQNNYIKAKEYYTQDGNLYELTNVKIGLAISYLKEEKYNLALREINDALDISTDKDYKNFKVKSYRILADVYAGLGQYKKAFSFSKKYRVSNAEVFEKDKTEIVFELEKKYETEKKEKEILTQRAKLIEKELNINRKNTQLLGLCAVVILLAILGYLIYNQQKLKHKQLKREAELKAALARIETQNKLQEQRLRISRDLHDNIGAQLTFIISSIENLQYGFKITNNKLTNKLKGISEFTKDTIYELRDTIWAMNKSEISLEDLETRISNFIEKADENTTGLNFKFEVTEYGLNNIVFSSVKGMNMYRIIQEAIHNALKYAQAKNVLVTINKEDQNLNIEINDDGNGFDLSKIEKGNGLNNMKKRATNIAANFEIITGIEKGTTIKLTVEI